MSFSDSGLGEASSPELSPRFKSELLSSPHGMNPPLSSMSRTHTYRKVMKPFLERKRRARINKCLDELKDIMVNALQAEGESISKLEKADVLELTVKHLRKLKQDNALGLTPQGQGSGRFKAGFSQCAQHVSKFMASAPPHVTGLSMHVSARLLAHLGSCLQALDTLQPQQLTTHPTTGPVLGLSADRRVGASTLLAFGYSRDSSTASGLVGLVNPRSPREPSYSGGIKAEVEEKAWRPW